MTAPSSEQSLDSLLARHQALGLLRVFTCGSVDDGKSTLIGRLLYDAKLLLDDQLSSLEKDRRTAGGDIDYSLLVDGLAAEREQGITIDVAYRFFATARRKFILADTPGHEQYTRNMVTGASTADLAIVLVDARKGILPQTRRHSTIVSLLGVRQVVLAVNKMDLIGYQETIFDTIAREFAGLAARLGLAQVIAIPVSAGKGDNVIEGSERMPWYRGPALLPFLETVELDKGDTAKPFRLPVQWVNRPDPDFRGLCGTIASGDIQLGDPIIVLPGGQNSRVEAIVTFDGNLDRAETGQAVTLLLEDDIDIGRGDVLVAGEMPMVSDQFTAHLVWMSAEPMIPERSYLFRIGTTVTPGQVTALKYQINVDTGEHLAARTLDLNGIAYCNLAFDRPVVVDAYAACREMGSFIVIDRLTNGTVGAGMIDHGLRRADNLPWQHLDVGKSSRASQKRQKPCVVWFTGLSGSGKSTIANAVEKRLHALGRHTYLLDGDNLRHGLNRDLGFTVADRVENIRRVGEVAKLMINAGLIVLVSFISPFRRERTMVREMVEADEFIEIFVDTPLAICEQRDPKGLYRKARQGDLKNFTGVDSPYEAPENPELVLDTLTRGVDELADQVIGMLERRQ